MELNPLASIESGVLCMPQFALRVGSRTEQGVRANNEDTFVVDLRQRLFLVADGMGGQDRGEVASSMAADQIPRRVHDLLADAKPPQSALSQALAQVNDAIIHAGSAQPEGRRMGTTAVVALQHDEHVFVANLGDSRAYLIRGDQVEQLTMDHSVAAALVATGALTPDEARYSPYSNVLHKFLGCVHLAEQAEVRSFVPQAHDRLLLASDGLTNHITDDDLRSQRFSEPQEWVNYLVKTALERGSRDNVTCIVVAFDPA
jgi:serine/threonine protein phosphatase PrpC